MRRRTGSPDRWRRVSGRARDSVNYFVTGTDTGVGKTYVTTLLIRALRKAGLDTVGMKPICCGDRLDAELLLEASGNTVTLDHVNPVWFSTPAAPSVAAAREARSVDIALIMNTFATLRRSHRSLLVEGVGGWRVPITAGYFVSDLARELGLPILVVVRNRLGAINHTLLTVERIKADGLECGGIVLNDMDDAHDSAGTNRGLFEAILDVPVLFSIGRGQRSVELAVV